MREFVFRCPLCNREFTNLPQNEETVAKPPAGMGAKHDQGKVRPSLILSGFPRAILAVAEVGMYGLTMHPEGSWKEVPNGVVRFLDAKDRHRLYGAIDPLDPDSNLLHLAHECWNALAALELILTEKEKDLSN
jgi:hypothetical protein